MNGIKKAVVKANFFERGEATKYSLLRTTIEAPNATISVLWNIHEISLCITYDRAERICVRCGNANFSLVPENQETLCSVRMNEIGTTVVDLGQQIPLVIEIIYKGQIATLDAILKLCDYQLIYNNPCNDLSSFDQIISSVAGLDTCNMQNAEVGSVLTPNGICLFDRYSNQTNHEASNHALIAQNIIGLNCTDCSLLLECDMQIDKMPMYDSAKVIPVAVYSCGIYFVLNDAETEVSSFFGIYRTQNDLIFFVNSGYHFYITPIEKHLGDRFHLGVILESDRRLAVYIDHKKIFTFSSFYANYRRRDKFTENAITIRMQRRLMAESHEDDFEVSLQNLHVIHDYTQSIIESISNQDLLGIEYPNQQNSKEISLLVEPLTLRKQADGLSYKISTPITWKSSNTQVLSDNAVPRRPETVGEFVTLSMMLKSGDEIVTQKNFPFFIPALAPQGNVLCVKQDLDPYTGSAVFEDTVLSLHENENSVVYDFGTSVTATFACLKTLETNKTYISKAFLSLYASEDNIIYTRISDFSILYAENEIFFYNFAITARYLKIHSVAVGNQSGIIQNTLQRLMVAKNDKIFLRDGGGTFTESTQFLVENTAQKTLNDHIVIRSLESLPINIEKCNNNFTDLRFVLNGKVLPYALIDNVCYIRVFELPNDGVTINILYGNPDAEDMQNAMEALEIQYGSRKLGSLGGNYWVNTVGKMPNGDLLQMTTSGCTHLLSRRSIDGGHTWGDWIVISNSASVNPISGGGFIVDEEQDVVFLIGHCNLDRANHKLLQFIIESHDSGYTWSDPKYMQTPYPWSLSYSDGIKLHHSKNGVNYVFSYCGTLNKDALGTASSFYSCNNGITWNASNSHISFGSEEAQRKTLHKEGGCSEETIYEKKDGTLVMWTRYETSAFEPHFAVSRSYDSGITWGETRLSNIYASNTQPIIVEYNNKPLLFWGGNNAMGSTSHVRFPFSIAYSNDEAESFRGIKNMLFQTQYADLSNRHEITNPDAVIQTYHGIDHAFIVAKEYFILIEDFGNAFYKTKGAYDTFEKNTPYDEGWLPIAGALKTNVVNETRCMHLGGADSVSRSIPELRQGDISITFYIEQLGKGFSIDYQAAYQSLHNISAPLSLSIDSNGFINYSLQQDKIKTNLHCGQGKNALCIHIDDHLENVKLTLNGQSVDIPMNKEIGDYICYVNVWNQPDCILDIEHFMVIDQEDHTI